MTIRQDINDWTVGAPWGADFVCTNDAGSIDLTLPGTQVLFWLGTPDQKLITCTLGDGISVDPEAPDVARVDISPFRQAQAGLAGAARKLRYELWVTEPDGSESRKAYGAAYAALGLAKKYP